jgi:hypothetical protein
MLFLFGLASAYAGCASHPKVGATSCKAQGGTVRGIGMSVTRACVVPFTDGGRECKDGGDCQGRCKASTVAAIGTMASGTCQAKNIHTIAGIDDTIASMPDPCCLGLPSQPSFSQRATCGAK